MSDNQEMECSLEELEEMRKSNDNLGLIKAIAKKEGVELREVLCRTHYLRRKRKAQGVGFTDVLMEISDNGMKCARCDRYSGGASLCDYCIKWEDVKKER